MDQLREFAAPDEIKTHMKKIPENIRAEMVDAQRIYLETKKNRQNPNIPLTHEFLIRLAESELTDPSDTYHMALFLRQFPQITPLVIAKLGGKLKIARPMSLQVKHYEQITNQAKELGTNAGIDVIGQGKEIREKALPIIGRIASDDTSWQDTVFAPHTFNLGTDFEKLEEAGKHFWETIVPNLYTSKVLEDIAVSKEPSLGVGSVKV